MVGKLLLAQSWIFFVGLADRGVAVQYTETKTKLTIKSEKHNGGTLRRLKKARETLHRLSGDVC